MARTALTDARIGALRPRKIAYDIRDGKLGGFGVRVLPSGRKRFFVHSQHRGDRVWKKSVAEARRECHARKAEPEAARAPRRVAPLFRDTAYAHGSGRESLPPDVEVEVRAGERVECCLYVPADGATT